MAGNALYDVEIDCEGHELHDGGHGRAAIAALLGMPARKTVRTMAVRLQVCWSRVLAMIGKKHPAYSFETKLAAVRAVVDEGMTKPEAMEKFGIASPSPFKKWLKAYREGPEALRPKPRGRPRGSGSPSGETTGEQELKHRVKRLEAENAYLKKSIALKAEKRSRTARRPRS